MHCVSSSSLSLIWNGKRLPNFSPSKGLRQGDPLSPYLFILCMEKLSLAISEAVQDGRWKPISVSRGGPKFSHLFADDILLFAKATCAQTRFIQNMFTTLRLLSELRVNFDKSRAFYSFGIPKRKIDKLTAISTIRSTPSLEIPQFPYPNW